MDPEPVSPSSLRFRSPVQDRIARHAMMNNNRSFVSARRGHTRGSVAVTFPKTISRKATEMLLILSLERIAGSAQTVGEDLRDFRSCNALSVV